MSTPPSSLAAPPALAPQSPDGAGGAEATPPVDQRISEGSLLGQFVAILTPFFALLAGWLAGIVAKAVPGVTLDKNQIIAFMVAVTTTALGAGYKWLTGWQEHERRVAAGQAIPVKLASPPKA
jgi:hypothetical protein